MELEEVADWRRPLHRPDVLHSDRLDSLLIDLWSFSSLCSLLYRWPEGRQKYLELPYCTLPALSVGFALLRGLPLDPFRLTGFPLLWS